MLTGPTSLEPMERIERSSVAHHATAPPLSYIGLEPEGYSKPRPPRYKCGAPSLWRTTDTNGLCAVHLSYSGASTSVGASAENRTPFVGPAVRCPANRPHPQNSGADMSA